MKWVYVGLTAVLIALVASLALLDLPRIVKATGYAAPRAGVTRVVVRQAGPLNALLVTEGSHVRQGDLIARVSTETTARGAVLEAQQIALGRRKVALLISEARITDQIAKTSATTSAAQLGKILEEQVAAQLEKRLATSRLSALERQLDRHEQLTSQGFVSAEALEQRRSEVTDQRIRLQSLERTLIALERDSLARSEEIALIDMRARIQASQIQRELSGTQQEIHELGSRVVDIIAPITGRVTQVTASIGQTVRAEIPIMSIVPHDSPLEVVLMVPSKAVGFMRAGQRASIRYQAFPHEHYGRHKGIVRLVSAAALAPHEISPFIKTDEPTYKVHIDIPSQFISTAQVRAGIAPGMLVEADVEMDRLKLYQWLLEPLFRLGSRL